MEFGKVLQGGLIKKNTGIEFLQANAISSANNRTNLAEKKVEVHRMDMIINQKIDSQTDVDRLTTDIFDKLQKNLK